MAATVGYDVVWIGLGQMGKALLRRLVDSNSYHQHTSFHVWNRNQQVSEQWAAAELMRVPGARVFVHASVAAAVACGGGAEQPQAAGVRPRVICAMLSNYAVTGEVLSGEELREVFESDGAAAAASLICMNSGTPDQAREFAAKMQAMRPGALYIDGCFVGSPHAVRDGKGRLLYTSPLSPELIPPEVSNLLKQLSPDIIFCGEKYGSCKALDYALVDHFFLNFLSLAHALSITEHEGVSRELLLSSLESHGATFPAAWARMVEKMKQQNYHNDSASLAVWREFFAHRKPYLDNLELPSIIPDFACSLIDLASTSSQDTSLEDDLIRLHHVFQKPSLP